MTDNLDKIDHTGEKYQVLLKFVNKILLNIDEPKIDKLTDFKDIDREDIIKDVNKQALDDMQKELFAQFNKKNCGYYRKTPAIVLNCLRGMMKEIGLNMVKKQKEKCDIINGKSYEMISS